MKLRKIFSIAILLILLVLAVFYLKNNYSDFQKLTIANLWLLTHDGIETKEKAEYLNSINKIPNGI